MPRPLVVTIPHRMAKAEAKRRIAKGMSEIRAQLAPFVRNIEDRWEADRLNFSLDALGQSVRGVIEVLEDAVHVEVLLPWFLAALGRRIADRIRHQGRLLLERK